MKKDKLKLKKIIYKHRLQILLLILAFALIINLTSVTFIMYKKKSIKPVMVYENSMQFFTINTIETKPVEETVEEVIEEKPIVIQKAPVNDKEDGEKKFNDSSTSNAKETTIEEAKALYETEGSSFGIDVSKWNGNINWQQVAASGVDFAIIRCGYRGYGSEGKIVQDPYFEQNIKGALKNGIKVGIYFYSTAINEAEALEEAKTVVEMIKNYKITYPVAYDFENYYEGRCAYLNKTIMTNNALAFLNYVKSKGYTPMMYASKDAYQTKWETARFSGMKNWLAHYTDKTDYTGKYNMWQYTDVGRVPGISKNVDLNIAYFKYSADAPAKETPKIEEKPKTETPNNSPSTQPETPKKEEQPKEDEPKEEDKNETEEKKSEEKDQEPEILN